MIIKNPWEVMAQEENQWMLNMLLEKDIPYLYTKKPDDNTWMKVNSLMTYLSGTRNFILIISDNSAYVKSLYYYLGVVWLASTNQGFEIADIGGLDKTDYDYLAKLEHTSLLMAPYTDPSGFELRRVKNIIGNIMLKRKVRHKPTIMDLFARESPSKINNQKLIDAINVLASLYGEQSVSMFMDKDSNSKIIKIRR